MEIINHATQSRIIANRGRTCHQESVCSESHAYASPHKNIALAEFPSLLPYRMLRWWASGQIIWWLTRQVRRTSHVFFYLSGRFILRNQLRRQILAFSFILLADFLTCSFLASAIAAALSISMGV